MGFMFYFSLARLGIVLLALLSFFFPLAALLAGVVVTFFLAGLVLLRLLETDFNAVELLGFSVLASVLASTHLVYWTSMLFGYSAVTISLVFLFIALAAFFVPMPEFNTTFFKGHKNGVLLTVAIFVLFLALFNATLWVQAENGFIAGGWNYSDLFAHLPITESINEGNFPPQTPFFSGSPLTYHWFVDLHTAMLSKTSGVFSALIMRFENALYVALLALFSYMLALRFSGDKKTAAIAAFLVIFGGGFAFAKLTEGFSTNPDVFQLVKNNAYDNDGQFFQIPSNLGGYLIPQRPQMVGFAALAAILYLLTTANGSRRKIFLAGLLAALLAPFQYFAFATTVMLGLLYFACEYVKQKRLAISVAKALLFLAPLILAVPFALAATQTASSASLVKLEFAWLAPQEPVGFITFYLANLGLPLVIALLAIFLYKNEDKMFIALSLITLFLIPNVITLSGTRWDMTKFFAYFSLFTSILAATLIARQRKAIAAALIALCCLTGILMYAWTIQSTWVGLSSEQVQAGGWVKQNTPQKSVFLAYHNHNHPVDSIGGRFRITGYGSWVYNYGLNAGERERDLQNAYCGAPEQTREIMEKYGAKYVYAGQDERANFKCSYAFSSSNVFKKDYDFKGIAIYSLAG